MDQSINIVNYQNQSPQIIANTSEQIFASLIKQKVYQINLEFSHNQLCIKRLINFINAMEFRKQNIKIMRSLIKFYQIPILYFFKDFYIKIIKSLQNLEQNDQIKSDAKQKIRNKTIKSLQQIACICCNLTENIKKTPFFSFITQFGVLQKEIAISKINLKHQINFFKFLSECLKQQDLILSARTDLFLKQGFIRKVNSHFKFVIQKQKYCFLEKFTVNSIIQKVEQSIQNFNLQNINQVAINTVNIDYQTNSKAKQNNILEDLFVDDLKNISPCCRTFFYENQIINQAQTAILEYKNYKHPYDRYCCNNLKKVICGFLNRAGGFVLLGIAEYQDKAKEVKGQIITENKKEEILKDFRSICQGIQPDIISNHKYSIRFVPIKSRNDNFIPGKYILRAEISAGDPSSMYSYIEKTNNSTQNQFIAIRTANQVLRRQLNQQILKQYKQKLLNPKKFYSPHQRQCPQPEIGEQILHFIYNKNSPKQYVYVESANGIKSKENISKQKYIEKKQNLNNNIRNQLQAGKIQNEYENNQIYFNCKKSDHDNKKFNDFACDQQDEQATKRKQKLKQKISSIQQLKKNEQKEQLQEGELDFIPNNKEPLINNSKNKYKKPFNPTNFNFINANSTAQNRQKQQRLMNSLNQQENYRVNRQFQTYSHSTRNQRNITSLKQKNYTQFLVAGFPFNQLKLMLKYAELSLAEEPIQCHHKYVTWIKVNNEQETRQKLVKLMKQLIKRHKQLNIDYGLKIRKLHSNLFFQEDILLNKLVNKFKHSEQFMDKASLYYFKCKSNFQAIQGYICGWQKGYKVKFISDQQLKSKKLKYLSQKATLNNQC